MPETTEVGVAQTEVSGGPVSKSGDILGAISAEAKNYGNMLNIVYLLQFMVLIMP